MLHTATVEVDDAHEALVMQVSPREDPSPMNVHSGTVLLVHEPPGWRATVLAREEPEPRDDGSVGDGWRVALDHGHRVLVPRHVLTSSCENASSHGHHLFRQDRALRVYLAAGEVRWFECMSQNDDEDGTIPWHVPDPDGGDARRPAPRWCPAPALTEWRAPRRRW